MSITIDLDPHTFEFDFSLTDDSEDIFNRSIKEVEEIILNYIKLGCPPQIGHKIWAWTGEALYKVESIVYSKENISYALRVTGFDDKYILME